MFVNYAVSCSDAKYSRYGFRLVTSLCSFDKWNQNSVLYLDSYCIKRHNLLRGIKTPNFKHSCLNSKSEYWFNICRYFVPCFLFPWIPSVFGQNSRNWKIYFCVYTLSLKLFLVCWIRRTVFWDGIKGSKWLQAS